MSIRLDFGDSRSSVSLRGGPMSEGIRGSSGSRLIAVNAESRLAMMPAEESTKVPSRSKIIVLFKA